MALDLTNAMQESRRSWRNAFKFLRESGLECKILDSSKFSIKCKDKWKTSSWTRTQKNLTSMHSLEAFRKFLHQTGTPSGSREKGVWPK